MQGLIRTVIVGATIGLGATIVQNHLQAYSAGDIVQTYSTGGVFWVDSPDGMAALDWLEDQAGSMLEPVSSFNSCLSMANYANELASDAGYASNFYCEYQD